MHLYSKPKAGLSPLFRNYLETGQNPVTAIAKVLTRFLRLLLLTLVLVLVALISALTAMRIAIHGREVEVPKLTGLAPAEAESALLDRGLRFELENRFYSDVVPEGRVLSQLPPAGTIVRRGWRVRVAESLGTPRAKVPNVMGQSNRAAEINLRRRGLEVGKLAVVRLPNLPPDQVVAVSPPPETVGNSPKVSLLLTATNPSQTLLMPNVVGRRLAEVERLIAQSRLRVAKVSGPTGMPISDIRGEIIRRQFPAAGAKVTPETLITLDVDR